MTYLYTVLLQVYELAIRLAAFWQPKARSWVAGRQSWSQKLRDNLPQDQPRIWMHCASVGEFEQGRPVLEALRRHYPDHFFLLSFYSPSGYELRKATPLVDWVGYLPLDTPQNAREWVYIVQPELTIFVKYEFWYHFLITLQERQVPTLLIAGIFRPGQWFFRWYGRWALPMLRAFDRFFLQDESSALPLQAAGYDNYQVVGDPRIDRVLQIAKQARSFPKIAFFKNQQPVLIIGSSWPEDERSLWPALTLWTQAGWKIIIAPHEVSEDRIQQLERSLEIPSIRYSQLKQDHSSTATILIIDNIGMLAALYRYGELAYVGGGFGKSIHNILEPAAHGLPVLFGPHHEKFPEATGLINAGGGFAIRDSAELLSSGKMLLEELPRQRAGQAALTYLKQSQGATDKIIRAIRTADFSPQ